MRCGTPRQSRHVGTPGISTSPCSSANWPPDASGREISDGLSITCGKLSHLGLHATRAKSTLSFICETSAATRAPARRSSASKIPLHRERVRGGALIPGRYTPQHQIFAPLQHDNSKTLSIYLALEGSVGLEANMNAAPAKKEIINTRKAIQ